MSDEVKAGPDLDAEVARRVFGIDVLGITGCTEYHDESGLYVDEEGQTPRPVYARPWPPQDDRYACGCVESAERDRAGFIAFCAERGLSPDVPPERIVFGHAENHLQTVDEFSTDIRAAWEVVEHFRAKGWLATVKDMPPGYPFLGGDNLEFRLERRSVCDFMWMPLSTVADTRRRIYRHPHGVGDTPAEAICRAALATAEAEADVTDDEVRAAWGLPEDAPLIPLIGGPAADGER